MSGTTGYPLDISLLSFLLLIGNKGELIIFLVLPFFLITSFQYVFLSSFCILKARSAFLPYNTWHILP